MRRVSLEAGVRIVSLLRAKFSVKNIAERLGVQVSRTAIYNLITMQVSQDCFSR